MKSKYETHVKNKLVLVEGWSRNGLSEEQIAKNLGVGYSTFREYKKKHPALVAAVEKGREVVDFEVEGALIKRALGYSYYETTEAYDEEVGGLVPVKRVLKHVPPEVNAAKLWLINRRPDIWKTDPCKIEIDREILKMRKKELDMRMF